jgi:hypothetical protein
MFKPATPAPSDSRTSTGVIVPAFTDPLQSISGMGWPAAKVCPLKSVVIVRFPVMLPEGTSTGASSQPF